MKKIGQSKLK